MVAGTLLLGSTAGAACFAQSGLEIKSLHHTDDTDSCLSMMQAGLSTIPSAVQQDISRAGISVVLTPKMTYDEPESSGQHIFREGGTTENIGGLFEPDKMRVIIPERASVRNGAPRPMGQFAIKVMRHELGHAWDYSLGWISQKSAFLAAYDQDFSKLTNEQCRSLAYVITGVASGDANVPTVSGHHECLAESFAALCTPRSSWTRSEKQQSDAFPHVAAYLQSLNPDLGGGAIQARSDRPSASVPKAEPIEENVSSISSAQFEKAQTFFKQKLYAQALTYLDQAIRSSPTNGKAYMLRGTTQMWLKNYQASAQDYSSYIKIHPQDADGYALRARAYAYMGLKSKQDADEAIAGTLR